MQRCTGASNAAVANSQAAQSWDSRLSTQKDSRWELEQMLVHPCSQRLHSQQPKGRNSPNVCQQKSRKTHVSTHVRARHSAGPGARRRQAMPRDGPEPAVLREGTRHRMPHSMCSLIPFMGNIQNRHIPGLEGGSGCQGLGRRWRETADGCVTSFWGDGMFWN